MNKITIKINIDRIDKSKIKSRSYKNKSGVDVTVREYEVEVIPIREEKVVHSTDKYDFVKVGFASDRSVKRPDGKWEDGTILGDAIEIRSKSGQVRVTGQNGDGTINFEDIDDGSINPDDIPF